MKINLERKIFVLVSVIFLTIVCCGAASASTWHNQTLDDAGISGYADVSIATSSGGKPHIAYTSDEGLKYTYYDGKKWVNQTVDSSVDSTYDCSLALSSYNQPRISYGSYDGNLKFAIWNGTAWKKQNLDYSGQGSSLALDSYNKPRISYTNLDGGLRIAYWTGNQWKTQTLDQCSDSNFYGSVGENSLALDSYNNMRISYTMHYGYGEETPSFSHSELKLAIWTGSKWSKQVLDSTAPYSEKWITLGSLVLDSKNRPHINYVKSFTLKYAKWTGTTWSKTALEYATGYSSLALDSAGNPHICYEVGSTLYFAAKHGVSSWNIIELIDPGFIPSLVLGGVYEQPQIAYVDIINGLFRYVWFS